MDIELLDKVNFPNDIKDFSTEQLKQLCAEIREYMIECCSKNPGHLGSSLGAVELIVGLHHVYDTPKDKIVFDVGHQAYAHKILTGRRELFKKNRKKDGICGFTKRQESEYDVFGAGHSSTSISAALGLAKAAELKHSDEKVVALIGDGALSGGLAFEGLNNAGNGHTDILVIINDNNISIDKNIGAIHEHLLNLTTNPRYNALKKHIWERIGDGKFRKALQKMVVGTKSSLVMESGGDFFEALGFRYFGPIDGNDIKTVVEVLGKLKNIKGPRILHTITKKGKGYAPAEEDQTTWHAPGMFDPVTGKRIVSTKHKENRYQDIFGEVLVELARMYPNIVGVTPAMASGCGMNLLAKEIPERFFDVGIEEEHAVTFSAGLAAGGMKPFCNIYSSFSQRAYDQIIHDVCLQNLGVVLCLDRAGLVGEDGATHHGTFDIAAYRNIPNAIIACPADEYELKNMMYTAARSDGSAFIIRYPRGYGEGIEWRNREFEEMEIGKGTMMVRGSKIAIVAAGPYCYRAREAAEECGKNYGLTPYVYNIRFVKPLDTSIIDRIIDDGCDEIITVEDGSLKGGLYGAVAEYIALKDYSIRLRGIGIPDRFIGQGTQSELRSEYGLDSNGILNAIMAGMQKNDKKDQKILENKN